MLTHTSVTTAALLAFLGCFAQCQRAMAQDELPAGLQSITVNDGVELHYLERGEGTPLIFVHGASADFSVWQRELAAFSDNYRVITYSRRYNFPNQNEVQANHSAKVEADDLAALIWELKLSRVHVVGYSYGAYTALLLTLNYPEFVHSMTLAEPPVFSWLDDLPDAKAEQGRTALREFQTNCLEPSKAAFLRGETESGIRQFIDGTGGPETFDNLPPFVRRRVMRNSRELQALITSDELHPQVDRQLVEKITVPTLMISGENSPTRLKLADDELERLLPASTLQRVVLPNATHLMWVEEPEECHRILTEFLSNH